MKYKSLSGEVFDDTCEFNWNIITFIGEHQDETNKGFVAAVKHLKKASSILEKITEWDSPICPMYGCPEMFFEKKDHAEERLREETMIKLMNKKLLATQWKDIVKQILHGLPESRETIDRLISE